MENSAENMLDGALLINLNIKCHPVTFGSGHRDPNSPYNKFKGAIKSSINPNNIQQISKEVSIKINITIYIGQKRAKRSDLDNYLKPIIDALEEALKSKGFVENKISEICIKRIKVDKEDEEGIEFSIFLIKGDEHDKIII